MFSVLIEVIIAAGAVFIAVKKQKRFGRAIAATSGLYVCFDLSRMGIIPFPAGTDAFLFPAATIAMLVAAWLMMKER
jgi:drug/metabolite transporter superfamily protein YnfA